MRILYNARIYTLDSGRPTASAIVLDGGRVLALGEKDALQVEFGARSQLEDMGGATIIPGLVDAHFHLENYALGLQKVDCETKSRAECLERVAERVRQTPAGEWVLGHGWNQNNWEEGFGTAQDLDQVAKDHPVYLTAKSLHAAWANSAALQLANINKNTPDPQDGKLGRDASGEPNGLLFESAMDLMQAALPEATPTQVAQAIQTAEQVLFRMGVTGVHDFDRRRCFVALQELHQAGTLRLRVLKSIPLDDLPHAVALGIRTGFGDDTLRIGGVKMFADGALGPRTAAMLQPFEGEPENRGMLMLDSEEVFEHGSQAVENGISLAVHAIGDRANHEVLDAFSQLRQFEKNLPSVGGDGSDRRPLRHRIEHVQLIHPDDAPRLAALGVIASMQPIHAPSDMNMADKFWGERAALSYAWRTQLDHGASLAFGSDAPVESPNPFWGLYAAVTRRGLDGSPGEQGWYPEQRLSLMEALHGFTIGAAYAAGTEDHQGRLLPGYLADLLVLPEDPFTCSPEALKDMRPTATMIGGRWVYRD